jgi:hypothetical protein
MNFSRFSWALLGAMAIATSILVMRAERNAAAQALVLRNEQEHSVELERLQDEHRRLSTGQLSAAEREQLEFKRVELEGLRAMLLALKQRAAIAEADKTDDNNVTPEILPSAQWIYAGRATPRSVIMSVLWSASHGDVDHLADLLGFTDDIRSKADAMFSQLPAASQQEYGSPERVIATLLAGSFPKNATAMTIVDDHTGDQEAELAMRIDHSSGGPRTNSFDFRRSLDGWQLMVPWSVMDGYAKTMAGEQSPSETSPP